MSTSDSDPDELAADTQDLPADTLQDPHVESAELDELRRMHAAKRRERESGAPGPITEIERRCPECGNKYPSYVARCPDDGALLSGGAANTGEHQATEADADEPSTIAGTTIDKRFYIGRLIGQGAMGRVYRGSQLSVGRPVAIKVLRKKLSSDPTVRKRFLREAKLISSFHHPNIVRLIDYGEEGDLLYMVMEYIEGLPLQRLMRGRPMAFAFAIEVIVQMCGALSEAHTQNVVHRDIKPDNVFLVRGPTGRLAVKILDFGIAHVDRPVLDVDQNLTREGMVFGTPEYMSPEQARGRTVDRATDLYAAGVLLFELLTGELPIQGMSPMETMIKQIRDSVPDVRAVAEDVPAEIAQVVAELLLKDPTKRLSDARELQKRLLEIRDALGLEPLGELPEGDLETLLENNFVRGDAVVNPIEYSPPDVDLADVVSWADEDEPVTSPPARTEASSRSPTLMGAVSPAFVVLVLAVGILIGVGAAVLVVTLGS